MRTISDEQRREVAAWMRSESESWRDTFPSSKLGDDDNEAIVFDISSTLFEENPTVSEFFARLADLIDRPTCHDVSSFNDVFKCSECGVSLDDLTAEVGSADFMPLYCPACGAEVCDEG